MPFDLFIERLELLRKERNITRKQMLEDCGLGKNQIAYWIRKKVIPGNSTIITLALYFGVRPDYLKGKTDIRELAHSVQTGESVDEKAVLISYIERMNADQVAALLGIAKQLEAADKDSDAR